MKKLSTVAYVLKMSVLKIKTLGNFILIYTSGVEIRTGKFQRKVDFKTVSEV